MSKLNLFRDFITQRLTTATMEVFRAAEKSFAEFEGEISRSREESARLQQLLDNVTQPDIKLHRTDVQQLSFLEPPQIKEEQELWTNQEEEQLQGLQSETTHSTFTSTSVKHDWDQEDFTECSYLVQTVKVENGEGNFLPTNTTVEQINAEPCVQDYAAPEPGSDSQNNEALPRENMHPTEKTIHQCQQCNKTFGRKDPEGAWTDEENYVTLLK
ncbi:uncharacterized protein LOC124471328 isoform X2 [Hypomesus transpacificus]|uniref:uncharacterized protein LOC124471328 isoform X2 n=1 Tax=Hypomesus transpacificus TaxID=137520 RepID=UPI001F07DB5F|nr:uncharacterized protein LOC124471328 isoform X2 [Hypomesus transpacificus]